MSHTHTHMDGRTDGRTDGHTDILTPWAPVGAKNPVQPVQSPNAKWPLWSECRLRSVRDYFFRLPPR